VLMAKIPIIKILLDALSFCFLHLFVYLLIGSVQTNLAYNLDLLKNVDSGNSYSIFHLA